MSLRGVRQLKELLIRYSDYDGSSKGVREWMRSSLVPFASSNPELTVKAELKRCKHPIIRGTYMNGNSKTICVKNITPEEVEDFIQDLRRQIGRKVIHLPINILLPRAVPAKLSAHTNSVACLSIVTSYYILLYSF